MDKASLIVSQLLEDDEQVNQPGDEVGDPNAYLDKIADERESGDINVYNADNFHTFYHKTVTYADGYTPYQARRNGRTKRWRTRPTEFSIPIKIGFKGYGTIDQNNASEWSSVPPVHPKPAKKPRAAKRRTVSPPPPPPERPAPHSTMSPEMHKEWEKQQKEIDMRVPRAPQNHPELPL
jgi:hypothetical protein